MTCDLLNIKKRTFKCLNHMMYPIDTGYFTLQGGGGGGGGGGAMHRHNKYNMHQI